MAQRQTAWIVAALLAVGCDPSSPSGQIQLIEEQFNGALLGGWSNGDEALLVGGQLAGSPGLILHYQDGEIRERR